MDPNTPIKKRQRLSHWQENNLNVCELIMDKQNVFCHTTQFVKTQRRGNIEKLLLHTSGWMKLSITQRERCKQLHL